MGISSFILKLAGWKVECSVPDFDKCIIAVAPHTSNWDFVLGKLAYWSLGRQAGFLMKEAWFFFPLNYLFKAIGGIPVPRRRGGSSLTQTIIEKYNSSSRLSLAITPEGTRSRTSTWHTGFLHIALGADIPIVLGAIDYARKEILLNDVYHPSGDIEADMKEIKRFYSRFTGKYPDKFSTDD